ncbi:MAG: DcaP family trimeric outer membrane transporter [Alistipes sp.]
MKTFRLLIVALLLVSTASAQRHSRKNMKDDYAPTVYLVSTHVVDTITECGRCPAMQAAAWNRAAMANAIQDYIATHRVGAQQVGKPQFVFATKSNKFSFSLGGFINLRAGYDFDGIVENTDFVPSLIPVPGTYATRQKLMMDGTTSRIFLKAIANTRLLGRIVIFVDTDFRGGASGSYTPRIRSAYVAFKGFTLGRDVSTFCDLQAGANTIDFQGPNAYNFNFSTMIRYEYSFLRKHFTVGVAAELPSVSGTYEESFAPIPQRMPDFPVYLQYAWGVNRDSHLRASAVFRNMYMHNLTTGNNTSLFGWGVQASGKIKFCRWFNVSFNGVYGEGITPYIQDLTGEGLDFTPNPANPTQIQTMPMYGWQAAGQIYLTPRLSLSGGYSMVTVEKKNGFYADDEYKQGTYMFGNIFYNLTSRCQIAAEYLYGTRKNMNDVQNHANRVNVMIQYNF